jgi:hypothetical protein
MQALVACLQDAGWDVQVQWGGTVSGPEMDPSQLDSFNAASDECAESSGWSRANDWGSWTDAQITALYEQEVATHECLVGLGFDSAVPPSEQAYLDTFHSADQYYAFNPGAAGLRHLDFPRFFGPCPPPTWFPQGEW